MTDPGWDVPGVPRDASPGADAPDGAGSSASRASSSSASVLSGAGSPGAPRKSGRQARAGSVSACSGLSAGAFAPLGDGSARAAGGLGPAVRVTAAVMPPHPLSALTLARVSDPPVSVAASATAPAQPALARTALRLALTSTASASAASVALPPLALTAAAAARPARHLPGGHCAGGRGREPVRGGAGQTRCRRWRFCPGRWISWRTRIRLSGRRGCRPIACGRWRWLSHGRQPRTRGSCAAFSVPGGGLAGDGHRSPRVWLTWQCAATRRAAAYRVSWMHRLDAHPVIAAALADGSFSLSWAAQIMDWTRTLPDHVRDAADGELLAAAAAGAA